MTALACAILLNAGLGSGEPALPRWMRRDPAVALQFRPVAQSRSEPRTSIDIQVIEASNNPLYRREQPSRAARDLASTLNFKSYRTLSDEIRAVALGESTFLTLANGATATLTTMAINVSKRTVRLRLQIEQGVRKLDTEYTVRDGGTVFVSAGNAGRGAVLVLAIGPKIR